MSDSRTDELARRDRTLLVGMPSFNAAGKPWRAYRFPNLPKVAKAQAMLTRRLEWLLPAAVENGSLVEAVRGRLKELLEEEVKLLLDHVQVARPKDLPKLASGPAFFGVLSPAPHKGRGLLEVELGLAHAAIDMLLGGVGDHVPLRPLTDIEEGVLSYLVLESLKALAPNLEPGLPRLRLEATARTLEEASVHLLEETAVVVVQLKVVAGAEAGFLRLFLPASLVGMAQPPEDTPEHRSRRVARLRRHLSRLSGIKTTLRAEIGHAEISAQDLKAVGAGDVVLLDELTARPDKGEGGTAVLRIGAGRRGKLEANVQAANGKLALEITAVVAEAQGWREAAEDSEPGGDDTAPHVEEDEVDEVEDGDEAAEGAADDADEDEGDSQEGEEDGSVESSKVNDASELLNDVPLQLAVELARLPVTAEDIVALKIGQVLELDRVPGEPVDLSVNGKIVARGEVVEVEGHLGVRILSLAG